MKKKKAKDFGDNPKVRRRYGEARRINLREPWELRYAGIKKIKVKKRRKKVKFKW